MTARGDVSPRWPHDRWISPSVINAYGFCPKRVRLQHLDKVPVPGFQRIDFTLGNAAHLALKYIAQAHARGERPPHNDKVIEIIRRHVPSQPFPSEAEWLAHVGNVRRWVERGRRHIERDSIRRWVLIEQNLTREWTLVRGMPPFTIMARPDLIVRHDDQDGVPVIEIIDYKTGTPRPDPMPALVLRLVARELLEDLIGDVERARIQFTYLWLESDETDPIDLTTEYIQYFWPHVERDLRRLVRETKWEPRPSPGCHYCPFYQRSCTEKIPFDAW